MSQQIALFGVESSFTPELVETAGRCGLVVAVPVIAGDPEWELSGMFPVRLADLAAESLALPFAVPWVTPGFRYAKYREAQAAGFREPIALIDPAAVVAQTAQISPGVFVNAGATVGAYAQLGSFVLVNRNASVGHHTVCEPFASIGPGVTVAARCRIGKGAMIGAGAVIAPGLTIGANCLVTIGAVVARNLPDNCVAAGHPARVTKRQISGYKGLGVP